MLIYTNIKKKFLLIVLNLVHNFKRSSFVLNLTQLNDKNKQFYLNLIIIKKNKF